MQVHHSEENSKGRFYLGDEDDFDAEMTYSKAGKNTMIIDHTGVPDRNRGKGYGKKLVQAGVDFAREKGMRVIPLCPFAKRVIEKDESLQDVLK